MDNLPAPPIGSVQLPDLVLCLEQATHLAKQLPAATDPNHLLQIYTSLHQSHHLLSSFLSHTQTHLQAPSFFGPRPAAAENSLSSATGPAAEDGEEEPMQVGDGEGDGDSAVDKVEERMKNFFIKNRRVKKRPLSPSSEAAGEERRDMDDGFVVAKEGFDPRATRLRSLDLIYQFHA